MRQPSKSVAWIFCTLGLVCLLAGWGGNWGVAYGQTAGPTPTPGGPSSVLTVNKSVNTPNPNPGQTFSFSIQVRNNLAEPQPDVVIEDPIDPALEVVSVATTKGTATVSGQLVRVEVGTLQPGEVVTVTITVRVRPTVPNGSSLVNVATVSFPPAGPPPGPGTPTPPRTQSSASNPIAISVGTAGSGPPSGLPNTGASGESNATLLALGALLLLAGVGMLAAQRRRQAAG